MQRSRETSPSRIRQNLWFWDSSKSYLLSPWGNAEEKKDCCKWLVIQCANKSGHVIKLDLSPSAFDLHDSNQINFLRGNISSSLVELRYLKHLDLIYIDFIGSRFPSFIGTLNKLRYLNLSATCMTREVPSQLANLSSLQVLDLGYYVSFDSVSALSVKNLEWLSHLSSLRTLDLSFIDLSKADGWLQIITNKHPYLRALKLSDCNLPHYINSPSSLSLVNSSTSLSHPDLSANHLSSSIYLIWVLNYSHSLVHLDLSFNLLQDSIPEVLGNMTGITYLDLSQNFLQGEIPNSICGLCTLRTLNLYLNNLSGRLLDLTQSSSKCTNYSLKYLDLSDNQITGSFSS